MCCQSLVTYVQAFSQRGKVTAMLEMGKVAAGSIVAADSQEVLILFLLWRIEN